MKVCSKCKKLKPVGKFYVNRRAKDGLASECKLCHNEASRKWSKANPERDKENRRKWHKANPEKAKESVRKWKRANPEEAKKIARRARLISSYGLTTEEYDKLLKKQGGVCAICGRYRRESRYGRLCVDHNHSTGEVRGLVCSLCNIAIGAVQEDLATLRKMIVYLSKPSKKKKIFGQA